MKRALKCKAATAGITGPTAVRVGRWWVEGRLAGRRMADRARRAHDAARAIRITFEWGGKRWIGYAYVVCVPLLRPRAWGPFTFTGTGALEELVR
jgi:hypothetical protein